MGKNKKSKDLNTDTDTSTITNTDTEKLLNNKKKNKNKNKNTSFFSKINNLSRKTKLYIIMIIILFLVTGYIWYKNKKNIEGIKEPIQIVNHEIPNNPIQEIQVTQQVQQPMQYLSDQK
jgi:hypothetical protein